MTPCLHRPLRGMAPALACLVLLSTTACVRQRQHSAAARLSPAPCPSASVGFEHRLLPDGSPVQTGVEERRIAGRVVAEGDPVAGAAVALIGSDPEPVRAATDERGEFDFGPRPAGTYVVVAETPGRAGALVAVDLRKPVVPERIARLELALSPCRRMVVGRVTDAAGLAIAGARVSFDVAGVLSTVADANGRYRLCRPERAGLTVDVGAPGYGTRTLEARWSQDTAHLDVVLLPEVTLEGTVVAADTGRPLGGATVLLTQGRTSLPAWTVVRADAQGRYRVAGVAQGAHTLAAFAGDYRSVDTLPVTVEAGERRTGLLLRVESTAIVRGRVLEEDGRGVAGATVTASARGREYRVTAVSQRDGSFVLSGVAHGGNVVDVHPHGLASTLIEVASGDARELVLSVPSTGTLCGRVLRDGKPLADIEVVASGAPSDGAVTDSDGRFVIRGVPPGTQQVSVRGARGAHFEPAHVAAETGAVTNVELAGRPAAVVSGRVVDRGGKPLADLRVSLRATPGARDAPGLGYSMTATGSDGEFTFASVPPGRYQIAVRDRLIGMPGILAEASLTVSAGDDAVSLSEIEVEEPRMTITGYVTDASGKPRAHVGVRVQRASLRQRAGLWAGPQAWTGADGRFLITNLPAGDYSVHASTVHGEEAIAAKVPAGGHVALQLAASGAVEGRLVDFRAWPRVTAKRLDGPLVIRTVLADGGAFRFPDLPPGTYALVASAPGEAAGTVVQIAAGGTAAVTLTAVGSGAVELSVVDFHTRAPAGPMRCEFGLQVAGRDYLLDGESATIGPDGTLRVAGVPAGGVTVRCRAGEGTQTEAGGVISLVAGAEARVELGVIARPAAKRRASFGATMGAALPEPRIERLWTRGPAERAGLQVGDLIVAVDGVSVAGLSGDGVAALIAGKDPTHVLRVEVMRGTRRITIEVRLGGRGPVIAEGSP